MDERRIDLPVIDISSFMHLDGSDYPDTGKAQAQKLLDACTKFGAFHVVGHGIKPSKRAEAFE